MEMIMAMPISITSTKSLKSQFLPTLCSFSSPKSLNFTTHHQFPLQTHPTFSQKSLTITSTPSSSGRSIIMQASASDSGENIGDLLGEVTIFTAAGEPVMMKDLWDQKEGIAVVALLRHFGCPCCWELASVLRESISTFQSAGVKLIAVGVGEPNKARILGERLPFPMDSLYADPERKLYDVLGLYYGVGRTLFNPASAKVFTRFSSFAQAVKNYTIKATPDDRSGVLQQGGMFVFKGKQLLYARKDEGTGDHAPLQDVINVCCEGLVA